MNAKMCGSAGIVETIMSGGCRRMKEDEEGCRRMQEVQESEYKEGNEIIQEDIQ
jgi:hypothetical protein